MQTQIEYSRAPYPPRPGVRIVRSMDLPAFIRRTRTARGLNQEELAEKLGVGQGSVSKWESGKERPGVANLRAIAGWAGVSVDELTDEKLNPVLGLNSLTVIGVAKAGEWVEEIALDEDQQFDISAPPSKRFPNARRYGIMVSGPSMNELYPDGTIVICVSVEEVQREPRAGDKVVCRRIRNGLSEVTIKEFFVDETGRKWLVPRSSDPRYRNPVEINGDMGEEVEVTGIVVGSYRDE